MVSSWFIAPSPAPRINVAMRTCLLIAAGFSTFLSHTSPLAAAPAASARQALGQPRRFGTVLVTPLKVIEDSRCPIHVTCIWAGRLVVRTRIERRGARIERDLTLGAPDTSGFGIVLDGVSGGNVTPSEKRPTRYRFHFTATPTRR